MSKVTRPLLSGAVRSSTAATCTDSHVKAVEAADHSRCVGSEVSGDATSSESSRVLVGTGQALQAAGHPPSAEEAAEAVHQLYDVLHGYELIIHSPKSVLGPICSSCFCSPLGWKPFSVGCSRILTLSTLSLCLAVDGIRTLARPFYQRSKIVRLTMKLLLCVVAENACLV